MSDPDVDAIAAVAAAAYPLGEDADYEPLLRSALARRGGDRDVLVVSLGFDTLANDPDAREGARLALRPADFSRMRAVLGELGLPVLVLQEGGYCMEEIPDAAEAFWVGATRRATLEPVSD